MNRRRVLLFLTFGLFLALVSTASLAWYSPNAQETVTQKLFADDPVLRELHNYKQWTRVNDAPLPVTISLVKSDLFALTRS